MADGAAAMRAGPHPDGGGSFTLDTQALPAPIRLDAWRAFWEPAVRVPRAFPAREEFRGRVTLRRLGSLVLLEMDSDPADYRRARSQALRDGLDHWLVAQSLDAGPGAPDAPWLGTLARGFGVRRFGGRWVGVFIPPERLPQLAPVFNAARAVPLPGPSARMLAGMLPRLVASVDAVEPDELPRLEAALCSMLVACLQGWELRATPTRLQLEAARRARVVALVDAGLADPALCPAELVARSGISRSELYRCFAPIGGIARVIQQRRLRRAFGELARADGPATVARVGEAVGFLDPSTFTRAFRREFGCTPSEVLARRSQAIARPVTGLAAALGRR